MLLGMLAIARSFTIACPFAIRHSFTIRRSFTIRSPARFPSHDIRLCRPLVVQRWMWAWKPWEWRKTIGRRESPLWGSGIQRRGWEAGSVLCEGAECAEDRKRGSVLWKACFSFVSAGAWMRERGIVRESDGTDVCGGRWKGWKCIRFSGYIYPLLFPVIS